MPTRRFSLALTVALAVLAITAFAGNSLLTRAALAGDLITPGGFATIRLFSGAIVLAALCVATRRDWRPKARDLPGGLALAAYTAAFSLAYVWLEAGSGALILFAAVGGTVALASLRTGFTAREMGGLVLAFAGLVWLLLPGADAAPLWPAALMALAGIAWGAYTLLGRSGGEPVGRTGRNFILAAPMMLPLLAIPASGFVSVEGVVLAVLCGAITSAAGYAVWYACLPRLPVIASGSVQLATPAAAALGGLILLGEAASWRLAGASTLILAGIALTLIRARQTGSTTPKA